MRQLALPIRPALLYSPEGFVRHAGVSAVLDELVSLGTGSAFAIRYIQGARRSGKTHTALRLHMDLVALGRDVLVIDGAAGWEAARVRGAITPRSVVLIDDADHLLDALKPEDEGIFVTLVEQLRAVGGKVFLFAARPVAELKTDDHVCSRLRLAAGLAIGAPADGEFHVLLEALARQRGLRLRAREVAFLTRRLGRDIQSLEYYLERLEHLARVLAQPIRFPLVANAV